MYFPVFLCLIFSFSVIIADFYNVGTMLFRKSDISKKCWSATDRDLLIARNVVQDLLPTPELVDFSDPEAISTFLEYFRTSFILVKERSSGETQRHLLTALADAVGGYLRAIVLPIARAAYYAGRLSYDDATTINALYEDLKTFLKTNGNEWKGPDQTSPHLQFIVTPLEVNNVSDKDACEDIIMEEADTEGREIIASDKSDDLESDFSSPNSFRSKQGGIPLPFLDSNENPTAIAIPWKEKPVISLFSNASAYIIPKFYVNAVKCIASMSNSKYDIIHFNTALHSWIVNKVVPHLKEEEWYVGFGGVLRVLESIKVFGVEPKALQETIQPDNHYIFRQGVNFEKGDTWTSRDHYIKDVFGKLSTLGVNGNSRSHLILLITCLALLFLVCSVCFCCSWCKRRNKSPRQVISNISSRVRSAVSNSTGSSAEKFQTFSKENKDFSLAFHGNSANRSDKILTKALNKEEVSRLSLGTGSTSLNLQDEKSFAMKLPSGDGWNAVRCPPNKNFKSFSDEKLISHTSSSFIERESESGDSSSSSPGHPSYRR